MKHYNVEHYVVKPNLTSGDWQYEYSTGSKINNCCDCGDGLTEIAQKIGVLGDTLSRLQNSLGSNSISQESMLQITNIVNQRISEEISNISREIEVIMNGADQLPQSVSIATIYNNLTEIQEQLNSNSQNITSINQYLDQLSGVNTRLTSLENAMRNISTDAIKQAILEQMGDSFENLFGDTVIDMIDGRMTSMLSNLQSLTTTVNSLNSTVGQLSTTIESNTNALNNHVNNSDIHVTAEDKAAWGIITSAPRVENETLIITTK